MNENRQTLSTQMLSSGRLKEKADILETNMYTSVSKQKDPSKFQFELKRNHFPDEVILKATVQLMPRINVKPGDFILLLRDLLSEKIEPGKEARVEKKLKSDDETCYHDTDIIARTFEAVATKETLTIIVRGTPEIKSQNGKIAKSFFDHEKSPGKLLKDGIINFKEINNYPIVNADDTLFYITHEIQGRQGLSFDGKIIPMKEAMPFSINIGEGVKQEEDQSSAGNPNGYFLKASKTGVVILERNENDTITGIEITEEVMIKKLDYSTGNVGTLHTCPISMKIHVVCAGFKIRVKEKVEVQIVDGGEVITNDEAVITKTQSGSVILALKDITVNSVTHTKIISERGLLTINRELIDSKASSPRMVFDKSKGLFTSSIVEAENLTFKGLLFSGENIVHFGHNLFVEKKEKLNAQKEVLAKKLKLESDEKEWMEKLQPELKHLTQLATKDHELVKFIKPLIIATHTMDFKIINREMDLIQKRNNTRTVDKVRKTFEALEKTPQTIKDLEDKEAALQNELDQIEHRMASMQISIEGFLRRAAAIKIFCGELDQENPKPPDFMIECEGDQKKSINITGKYSLRNGFEFAQ